MNDHDGSAGLLGAAEPVPAYRTGERARSRWLLTGDHAGLRVPSKLGDLGLPQADWQRHIACDIGVQGLGDALAAQLDATFIAQRYSRLVIDCNRDPDSDGSIVESSDGSIIPGNVGLDTAQRLARRRAIYDPYHACIEQTLAQRAHRGQPSWLLLLHSFTPLLQSQRRPWHLGLLYHRDARLALALKASLQALPQTPVDALCIGDNEPYSGADGTDVALNRYGEALGLPYVELEIRQDLIATPAQQHQWARFLADALRDLTLRPLPDR